MIERGLKYLPILPPCSWFFFLWPCGTVVWRHCTLFSLIELNETELQQSHHHRWVCSWRMVFRVPRDLCRVILKDSCSASLCLHCRFDKRWSISKERATLICSEKMYINFCLLMFPKGSEVTDVCFTVFLPRRWPSTPLNPCVLQPRRLAVWNVDISSKTAFHTQTDLFIYFLIPYGHFL